MEKAIEKINKLVELSNDFLSEKVSGKDFVSKFYAYFVQNSDEIYNYDQDVYNVFNEINVDLSYFDNDEESREAEGLIDEAQLRTCISKGIENIKNLKQAA